jgi:hypothetical protein
MRPAKRKNAEKGNTDDRHLRGHEGRSAGRKAMNKNNIVGTLAVGNMTIEILEGGQLFLIPMPSAREQRSQFATLYAEGDQIVGYDFPEIVPRAVKYEIIRIGQARRRPLIAVGTRVTAKWDIFGKKWLPSEITSIDPIGDQGLYYQVRRTDMHASLDVAATVGYWMPREYVKNLR